MNSKMIQQGAEAKIFKIKNKVVKDRTKKAYRIASLDNKIRTRRTKKEAKLLEKASKIINIPKVIISDQKDKKIEMDFIKGEKLSDHLNKYPLAKQKKICKQIGQDVAKLHDAKIIHGDLTTSNMILQDNKIYFIDFGLGYISHKFEDKAVDIHLLKQALEAKHFQHWRELVKEFLKGYSKSKDSKIVLERLKAVEKRGRYKH
ncbi:KEOPS complex kinase/ATPase Bud32 [Nanoarchaeota archaeon]